MIDIGMFFLELAHVQIFVYGKIAREQIFIENV